MALTDVSGPLTWCWSTCHPSRRGGGRVRRDGRKARAALAARLACSASGPQPCWLGLTGASIPDCGRSSTRRSPPDAPRASSTGSATLLGRPSAPPPGLRRHRDIPRRVRPAASTQGHSLHPRAARHARRPPGVQRSPRAAHPFAQRHRRPAPRRARRHRRPVCPLAGSAQAAPAG